MPNRTVNRCICHDKTFEEIKEYADDNNIRSVEELRWDNYCSCGCGLCSPYIEIVLETGETAFEPGGYYRKNRGGQ